MLQPEAPRDFNAYRSFSIPINSRFRRFDFESPWIMGEDSWDLVHLGMLCGAVTEWPELYANAFR